MAGITQSNLRRGLAVLVLGAAIAAGAGMVAGTQHAAAAGIPNKTCTGTGANGEAEPGASVVCTVSILGIVANGDQYVVQPATPAGATISKCSDTTVTTPFAYASKGALTNNACTWTISGVTGASAGNLVLGDETLKIPAGTASGTSVTQTMLQCPTVPPGVGPSTCGPSATPMGTSGAGSCVGGAALPIVGGCQPANPLTTPTPTPTPTASSSGGGTTTTDNGNGTTSGGVQAAAPRRPHSPQVRRIPSQ